MKRVLKDGEMVKIDRPFAIFVEEATDVEGAWLAHIIGFELDHITQGDSPESAVRMAFELISLLTGYCPESDDHRHDLSVDTHIGSSYSGYAPAWGCTRCPFTTVKDAVEEVP